MGLQLRRLRLEVTTEAGLYGRDLQFDPGLNILHVDNASGKSTCVQAIIYALGLEAMLSAKHDVPLPHAMLEYLEEADGSKLQVHESEVWLQVENGNGETLTIRRPVRSERDIHLVTVWRSAVLTGQDQRTAGEDFHVRQPGSATRERGFHHLLANFIGWDLPEVSKFDGATALLYLECIFPLIIVEQKRGWSGIQAAMPTQYGIQDVRKRAIEFVLDLDAHRIALRRAEIEQNKSDVREAWTLLANQLRARAEDINGTIHNLPRQPTAMWPPNVLPQIFFERGNQLLGIDSLVRSERESLSRLENEAIPQVQADAQRLSAKLRERSDDLMAISVAITEVQNEVRVDGADREALLRQIESKKRELAEYKDIRRIQKMGSQEAAKMNRGLCPTCEQQIEDSLLHQQSHYQPLSIDDNIKFLDGQKAVFQVMLAEIESSLELRVSRLRRLREQADELRSEIRDVKRTLVSDARIPSEAVIADRIRLRTTLESLTKASNSLAEHLVKFASLSREWTDILRREKAIPKGTLSPNDIDKLNRFRAILTEQLSKYGVKSLTPTEFDLSKDSYYPIYEQFDLGFDLAASDVIRMVWAYLIGLLELARSTNSNHPGLVVFDEPQQQKVMDRSYAALIERAKSSKDNGQQVLLATSEVPDEVHAMAKNADFKLERIAGWVLQPMVG